MHKQTKTKIKTRIWFKVHVDQGYFITRFPELRTETILLTLIVMGGGVNLTMRRKMILPSYDKDLKF